MTTRLSLLLRALIVGATALAWCALAFVARADEAPSECAPYAEFSERLGADGYGEAVLGSGVDPIEGALVELWVSPDTGTWTVLAVTKDRKSACLAAFGTGWSFGGPKLAGAPA